MNIAFVDWSLYIDCPHCEKEIDLVQYECDSGDNYLAEKIFTNRWSDISGFIVECPHCHHDFQIDKVEY